ncbi:hypothetical protein LTR94_038393, partial [Friedmanniomyces endolithicus]
MAAAVLEEIGAADRSAPAMEERVGLLAQRRVVVVGVPVVPIGMKREIAGPGVDQPRHFRRVVDAAIASGQFRVER